MDISNNDIRRLDMTLLLVFNELMLRRKTTLVAGHLAMSQSAVSQALTRLRSIFGEALFHRHVYGLEPTHKALELAPKIEALLTLSRDLLNVPIAFDPEATTRHFRIVGTIYTSEILSYLLGEYFYAQAPKASLSFHHNLSSQAFRGLMNDQFDLAFVAREPPPSLIKTKILDDHFVVVARAGHPALSDGLTEETYLSLPHINVDAYGTLATVVDEALAAKGLRRNIKIGMSSFASAFALLESTDMIATLLSSVAARYATQDKFVVYPCPAPFAPIPLFMVRHPRSQTDDALDWLTERAREFCVNASAQLPIR